MDRSTFRNLVLNAPLILDGATGTTLQENGLTPGICPTRWVLEHPDVLARLQTAYYENGSDIVLAFSFGANQYKLDPELLARESVADVNARVARISLDVRDACSARLGKRLYVAGDLSPTGHFLYPAGDLDHEALVQVYGAQVDGLLAAGVDLFVIETMLDLAQTRAAVIAVRDRCDLPVIASLTIGENGRSLSGDLPLAILLSLQAAGADAVGFNCSFGPDRLAEVLLPLLGEASVPLMIKPNAGMPRLVDGKTRFPLGPEDFAAAMKPLVRAGIRLLGGCCGTGPEHIRQLAGMVSATPCPDIELTGPDHRICSTRSVLELEDIGQLALVTVTDPDDLLDQVLEAQDEEPEGILLDCRQLSPSVSGDFLTMLAELVLTVSLPMAFSADPELTERILRQYPGRAAIFGPSSTGRIDALTL